MRNLEIVANILMLIGCLLSSASAIASDFYIVYFSDEPHDLWVELLDPATITKTQNGHLTARALNISSMDLWQDGTFEFDCSGKQYLTVASIAHLAGGDTIDRSLLPDVGHWSVTKPNTIDSLLLDDVCQWSISKMTGNAVYSAPDIETAAHQISKKLFDMEYKQ
jgi:hypothetical protein